GQIGAFLELHFTVLAAVMVGDRVERDLVEPGGEGMARVGVPLDISQCFEKHLRRHILCQRLVPNSGIRKAIDLREIAVVKCPKRLGVFFRPFDKFPLFKSVRHQGTPQGARWRLNGRRPLLVTCPANLPATPRRMKSRRGRERLRYSYRVFGGARGYNQPVTDGPPSTRRPAAD